MWACTPRLSAHSLFLPSHLNMTRKCVSAPSTDIAVFSLGFESFAKHVLSILKPKNLKKSISTALHGQGAPRSTSAASSPFPGFHRPSASEVRVTARRLSLTAVASQFSKLQPLQPAESFLFIVLREFSWILLALLAVVS